MSFHINFSKSFFTSKEKLFWDFGKNCIKSIDKLEEIWHLHNVESSNPRTQYTSPFVLGDLWSLSSAFCNFWHPEATPVCWVGIQTFHLFLAIVNGIMFFVFVSSGSLSVCGNVYYFLNLLLPEVFIYYLFITSSFIFRDFYVDQHGICAITSFYYISPLYIYLFYYFSLTICIS